MKNKLLHSSNVLVLACALTLCLQTMAQTVGNPFQLPALKSLNNERVFAKAPMREYDDNEGDDWKVLVTPPTGLVTETYTMMSLMMTSDETGAGYAALIGKEDHMQTLQIGFQGSDVYIKGLSTNFPKAWVKGVLNEDETAVEFSDVQYIGSLTNKDGETEDWSFVGTPLNFDKQSRSFTTSPLGETGFYEKNNYGYRVINLFPQIIKSVPAEELITPPSGLVAKDYLMNVSNLAVGADNLLLKVGIRGNDVYIQGLCPLMPDAWAKGTLSGNQIIFPKWQFLGESEELGSAYQDALNQQGIDVSVGNKKVFLYSLNAATYSIDDVVLQYDKDSGTMTMTEGFMILGLSRVFMELAVGLYQNILISPITEQSAVPSTPSISSMAVVDNGYCLAFSVPVVDEEGNGMLSDKIYYKVLTENEGQASIITFKPADYETLNAAMSLIPYGFTDGTYFTAPLSMTTGTVEKNVVLKGSVVTSLNKVGVQSVYQGGGTTNESEVAWFTIYEARELLRSEIYKAQDYVNDSSKSLGKDQLQATIDDVTDLMEEIDYLDEVDRESYNILQILAVVQQLKAAEATFLELNANANLDSMLAQLETEIGQAYNLYYDDSKPNGKDELFEAIHYAETLRDEVAGMDEEELKEFDMSIVMNEIEALKQAEQDYRELNKPADDSIYELEAEIYDANNLYYNYITYGGEALMEVISHAEGVVNDYYNLDEEERLTFDMSLVTDALASLREAEREIAEFNTMVTNHLGRLSEETYKAYDLHADSDLEYDKEVLMDVIRHAEDLYNEVSNMSYEAMLSFDFSVVEDEISALQAAETTYVTVNTIINEDEWQTLKTYHQSANGSEWKQKWDFSSSTRSRKTLPGVKSYDGHVLKIDLRNNNVAGAFPYSWLKLSRLEELDLSGNQLTGDIGEGMSQFLKTASASLSLRSLDISNNQLSGNIGTLANALTRLEELYASDNYLNEVTPVIPSTVTSLDLDNQNIQREVDLHLSDMTSGTLLQSIPNIMLYNHSEQTYDKELHLEFKDGQGTTVNMTLQSGAVEISAGYNYALKCENGDLLNTSTLWLWGNPTPGGIVLPIRLYFDEGDADFNGRVDILDLQTQIDYIFDEYFGAINFTAANLWKDETINVQDAVCMVNLLLDTNPVTATAKRMAKQKEQSRADVAGQVFICGGRLFINTTQPVAAFDIVVTSDVAFTLSSELTKHGMMCSTKKVDGQIHLIGYSLSGGTLPEGLTEIAGGADGEVAYAMCAGRDAREIPVALNLLPTDIANLTSDTNPSDVKYLLPLGTKHAIAIDAHGKKTLQRINR